MIFIFYLSWSVARRYFEIWSWRVLFV